MRDYIDAGREDLIVSGHDEYVTDSVRMHKHNTNLLAVLDDIKNDKHINRHRIIAQALFESGFLNIAGSCYNTESLIKGIYAIKMNAAINTFNKLFDALVANKYTGRTRQKMYNPWGDNFLSALTYTIKPTESDEKIRVSCGKEDGYTPEPFRNDIFRKVIYLENQSPTFAIILEHSIFTNTPTNFAIMRLRKEYNDPNKLPMLHKLEFNIMDSFEYAVWNTYATCKLLMTLDIHDMKLDTTLDALHVEHVLQCMESVLLSISK